MVARLMPTETPLKLTQENHPENAPPTPVEKPPRFTVASTVALGALCSVVGMTIGSAAFSTSQQIGDRFEVACMVPLVATLCAILGGWVAGFFHMIRSESAHRQE